VAVLEGQLCLLHPGGGLNRSQRMGIGPGLVRVDFRRDGRLVACRVGAVNPADPVHPVHPVSSAVVSDTPSKIVTSGS